MELQKDTVTAQTWGAPPRHRSCGDAHPDRRSIFPT